MVRVHTADQTSMRIFDLSSRGIFRKPEDLQCLRAVPELREGLRSFQRAAAGAVLAKLAGSRALSPGPAQRASPEPLALRFGRVKRLCPSARAMKRPAAASRREDRPRRALRPHPAAAAGSGARDPRQHFRSVGL